MQIFQLTARQFQSSYYKFQRNSHQLAHKIESIEEIPSFILVKDYLHKLQANRSTSQSEITKLSTYYRSLDSDLISSNEKLLNSVIYFTAIFSKNIPERFLRVAQSHLDRIDEGVLRAFAQKLLKTNQWPVAEKLINNKFKLQSAKAELMKFEVLALNGNYRKMVDQLAHLARSAAIPQKIQFQLLCLLNSKDGREVFDDKNMLIDSEWNRLLQISLKGKILSLHPPTLVVFLRQLFSILKPNFMNSNLLFLALKKCENENGRELCTEGKELLTSIYKEMSPLDLLKLAYMLRTQKTKAPDEVFTLLMMMLDQDQEHTDKNQTKQIDKNIILNTTLCWIIRNQPEKYSYDVLMTEFPDLLDLTIAEVALKHMGISDESAIRFVEFCMLKKKILFKKEILKQVIDVASEQFEYFSSERFIRFIHKKGYTLSPQFYLKTLKSKIYKINNDIDKFNGAYTSFKLIPAESLHGELLQEYLHSATELLDRSMCFSNIDNSFKIYTKLEKSKLPEFSKRQKTFSEVILENKSFKTFLESLQTTTKLDCIKAAIECVEKTTSNIKSCPVKLSERFCTMALQACLCQLDFNTAQKMHSYMKNLNYCDGGLQFSYKVLSCWLKISNKNM